MKLRDLNRQELIEHPTQKGLEAEWARYKYWVMSRSQKGYLQLRQLFKNNLNVQVRDFYEIIDQLKEQDEDVGAEVNAFQHVWGYFKRRVSDSEKKQFLSLLEAYRDGSSRNTVYEYLHTLSKRYEVTYLLESYYFDDY